MLGKVWIEVPLELQRMAESFTPQSVMLAKLIKIVILMFAMAFRLPVITHMGPLFGSLMSLAATDPDQAPRMLE